MSKPISPEHSSPTQPEFRRVIRRTSIFVIIGLAGLVLITSALISIPSIQLNLVEKAATALTSSTGLQASIQAIEVNWWRREVEILGIKLSNGEEKPLQIDVLGLARPRKRNGQWGLGFIRIEGLALQLDSLLSMSSMAENSSQSALWGVDQLKFRDIRIAYLGTTLPISDGSIDHLQGGASWGFESLELNIPSPEFVQPLMLSIRQDPARHHHYNTSVQVGASTQADGHFIWNGTSLDIWELSDGKINTNDITYLRNHWHQSPISASFKAHGDGQTQDVAFEIEAEHARVKGRTDGGRVHIEDLSIRWEQLQELGKEFAPHLLQEFLAYRPTSLKKPRLEASLIADMADHNQGTEFRLLYATAQLSTSQISGDVHPPLSAIWDGDTLSWEMAGLHWQTNPLFSRPLTIHRWSGKALPFAAPNNDQHWEAFWDLETSSGEHHGGLELSVSKDSISADRAWEVGFFGQVTELILPHNIIGRASLWAHINSDSDLEAVVSQGQLLLPLGEQHRIGFVHLYGNFDPGRSALELESDIGSMTLDIDRKSLQVQLDQPQAIAALIHPELELSPGLRFSTTEHKLTASISADIPGLAWNGWRVKNLQIEGEGEGRSNNVRFNALIDSIAYLETTISHGVALQLLPRNYLGGEDATGIDLKWNGLTEGHLRGEHRTRGQGHALECSQFDLGIEQETWRLNGGDTVHVFGDPDPNSPGQLAWEIDGLNLFGELGSLDISGRLGAALDDVLSIAWNDVPIAAWSDLWMRISKADSSPIAQEEQQTENFIRRLQGELSGSIEAHGLALSSLAPPPFQLDFNWRNAAYGDASLGRIRATGSTDLSGRIQGMLSSFDEGGDISAGAGQEQLRLSCDLQPNSPELSTADVQMWNWPLRTITPWIAPQDVQFNGSLSGQVNILNPLSDPAPDGAFQIDNLEVAVAQSGTYYRVEGDVILTGDMIALDQANLTDSRGNKGIANLSVFHENWNEFTYDVSVDLENEPFLCIDLPPGVNEFFYGKVLATGMLNVSGSLDGVQIEGRAQSHEGTVFSMPLDEFGDPSLPDHFHFIKRKNTVEMAPPSPFQMDLNLAIEALTGTEVEVIFDANQGDFMVGRGTGQLAIEMSRNEQFAMRGAIKLDEGNYGFSFRDLVHKDIELMPGGTMVWSGDPYGAQLSLETEYSIDASLAPLLGPGADHGRTPVQVHMHVAGAMNRPDLSFSLHFPRASAAVRAEAEAVLSREGETTRQAFALLVAGQFISPGIKEFNAQDAFLGNASELLSSQISKMLSQLSEEVDIGLRYTPSEENTAGREEDELAVAMATRLLDDRLRIRGSLGTRGILGTQSASALSTQNGNILGSVEIEYKLTDDGRWILNAYSTPSGADLFQAGQRHGIGISHRVMASTMRELFRRKTTDKIHDAHAEE